MYPSTLTLATFDYLDSRFYIHTVAATLGLGRVRPAAKVQHRYLSSLQHDTAIMG